MKAITKILLKSRRAICLTIAILMIVACMPLNVFASTPNIVIINSNTPSGSAPTIADKFSNTVLGEVDGGTVENATVPDTNASGGGNVAKVGNTEYATIDEAIANWTNGTTLTLLSDVTLSDVITLKSTEHHILNLGTYTMTAASGKNAIVIKACGTGSAERSAITIKADATNPGGINAGSNCVVYYKYADGGISTEDRPIIKIEGGVFTGSTSSWGTAGIYTIGTAARKCATLNISGGTFNCSINGSSKSKLLISGGTFNYSVGSQGDSTALRLISGGKFKTLGFMTADSNNTKFWFGTSMANSNVGLYVDKDGYLNVGGPVITELSAKYPAVASNATKWSSYLAYSSAATYGLFYEDADMAIKKHGEANVTIYEKPAVTIPENVTGDVVEEIKNNTALKGYTPTNLPEGAELEIELKSVGETFVFDVTPMADGTKVEPTEAITFRLPVPASVTEKYAKVYHDGTLMGIYEIKGEDNAKYVEVSSADFSEFAVEPKDFVAKIGDAYYESVQAAINAAQNGDTVVIFAGEYAPINISNKNITIKGTVGANGELLTTIKGGNPAITGHGFNGTIKDIKIVDAFKVMYAEPAGNVTVDNVYVTGATYGFHLVAYSTGLTWNIQNSYMDLSWANSFGVYGGGDAAIVITGNEFVSTNPYYPDYGAIHVNSFLPNITVTENIFGENAKIKIDVADTSKISISANYHVDGVENAFADDSVKATIDSYYTDKEMTNLKATPKGNNFIGYTSTDGIWGEVWGNATESFVIKVLDKNGNVMGTTSLNNIGGILNGNVNVTWHLKFDAASNTDEYWTMEWTTAPSADNMPAKVQLWVDGVHVSGGNIVLNGPDGLNKIVAAVADNGEIVGYYTTLADAIAAAKAGSEIVILADTSENITVPAGVIFNGNGKQVGVITAAGEITFKGHTKAANFGTKYTNTTINIVAGACLEITGTGRLVIGHGCTFNITGTITDAKTADKATLTPSLIMPGASFTGAGVTFNVTNAYIKAPSSYCSSSKSASGTFTFNITNSIFETAGKLAFESQSTAATVNFNLKDSVLTTGGHLVFGVSKGEIVIDNSNVNVGKSNQIENQSTMTIKNGSVVNGSVATSSNAKNSGTLIVDNATYAVTGEFSGSDLGTGTLIIKNGAEVSIGSITKANIVIDAAGMSAGELADFTANLSKFTGTLEVINNDKLYAKIVDGKIVLVRQLAGSGTEEDPYQIGSVEELILFRDSVNAGETKYNAPGVYVALKADIDMAGATWERGIGDGINATFDGIFDGNNKTIKNLNFAPKADSDGYFCGGLFGYTYGAAVIKNLVLENITVTATGAGHNVGVLVGFANNNGGKLTVSNVTVKNVTIDAPNAYGVGAIVGYSYRAMGTIEKCSVDGATITGYSFVGGITGYSYDNAIITDCSVKKATITATSKGAGGIAGLANGNNVITNNTVADTTVTAPTNWGYVVGELGASNAEISNNTANEPQLGGSYENGEAYQAKIGNKYYTSIADAIAAAQEGDTITLLADIEASEVILIDKSLTIDGNGHKITSSATRVFRVTASNVEVTLNDVNMVSRSVMTYPNDIRGISIDAGLTNVKLTLNNCSVDFTDASACDWAYAVNVSGNGTGHTVTVNGGSYEGANVINVHGANNTVVVKNATLTSLYPNNDVYYGACIWVLQNQGSSVEATGNTFKGANTVVFNVGTGTTVTESGNTDNTTRCVAKIGNTYYTDLREALLACKKGETVTLLCDIDLGSKEWEPIATFNGIFDGNNHTISNLVINGGSKSNQGFFGQTNDGEIKNITFENAKVTGRLNVGVVAGTPYTSKYTNVKVIGHVEVNGYAYVGGVGGKNAYANWTDITVDVDSTSYVKASSENYRTYVGGVVGFNGEGGHTFKNISSNIKVIGSTCDIGGLFGIAHYGNKFENVTFTGSVEAPAGAKEVGGIAGVWHNEKGTTVTFTNVTSTGSVTVGETTTTGSVVGGAYNASNETPATSGSLIIDGKEAWLAVAKIGETRYQSLAEALAAAKDGDIITLIWAEGDAPIAMNGAVYGKTVTITGTAVVDWSKGFLFVGRGGAGDATVIFDGANLTSASNNASYGIHVSGREKNTNNKYDGTLVIKNSTIELDYLINKGTMTLDNSKLTVKNGFAIGGRPASETESGADATATLNITNGSKVVVNNHNGMGLGYEAIGVMNIDATSAFETTQSFLVTAKGTMNVAGTVKITGTLTNNGSIVLTNTGATVTANECGNVTTNVADYKVVYADGAYKLVAKVYVAQVGDVKYESVQEAINAVQNGQTIVLLTDVTENVTLTEATGLYYTIDGNGKKMNGTITISALSDTNDNRRITIKNIKFVDETAAEVDFITSTATNHYPRITVEACTFTGSGDATDVAIRLKSSHSVVIKDCTGTGLHSFLQNTSGWNLTIENVTVTDSKSGFALGTVQGVTVKGCTIDVDGYGIRLDAGYNNNAVIESNEVNAFIPVVVRKATVDSTITFKGTNTMTATNTDGIWMAIGNSEYETNGSLPTEAKGNISVTVTNAVTTNGSVYGVLMGSGTEDDPYVINNVNDLIFFRDHVNAGGTKYNAEGVYVALTADIDLKDIDWSVNIGDDCNATFDGIFDGKGYTIYNLTSTETAQKGDGYVCAGLFGAIAGKAVIKNLTLQNVSINTGSFTGNNVAAVVGFAYNCTGSIENVKVVGNIQINAENVVGVGVIVGYAYGGTLTINNCVVDGAAITRTASAITGSSYVAGVVGYAGGKVTLSGNTVQNISVTATQAAAGGIAGIMLSGGVADGNTVKNVTLASQHDNWQNAVGAVTGTYTGTVTVTGTTTENNSTTALVGVLHADKPTEPLAKAQASINGVYYATFAEALAAAQSGDTIELHADITATEVILIDKSITINGNGHKVTSSATRVFRVTVSNVEVTLNDVNMVSRSVMTYPNDIRGISIDASLTNVKLTLNNCSVDFTDASACDWAYAVNVSGNGTGHTVTVNGGSYEGANVINVHGANNTVVVKDATLTSLYPNNDVYYGACIWVLQNQGSSVEATGNTFNGTNAVAFNVGTGTTVTESDNADNTGSKVVVAKIGYVLFDTLAEALAAAQNGDEVVILVAGEYALSTSGKNITITGAVNGVVFTNIGAHNMGGADVTFNNVTFNYATNSMYKGLQHSGNLVYNNCKFNGQVFLYGASETFNNCVFNNTGDNYNVWTYGAKEVTFNKCTFNCDGKAVLVYTEAKTHFINLKVADTTFNASTAVDGKAAIEIDTSLTAGANITVDAATTATGFGTGNVSGNSLWNNKKGSNTDATNDLTVKVGDETVLAPVTFVAKIGDIGYTSLAEAFAAAVAGDEVVILVAGEYALSTSGKDITITGAVDGVVFTNIGAKNMGGANVTFNNVTFTYANNSTYKGLQHAGNLVYNNCTFNGQVFLYGTSETFNNCTFNNTTNNYNVWTYSAKEVAFNECTFNSAGKAVLIYAESEGIFNDVTVTGCTFVASTAVDGKAAIEMDSSLTSGIKLTIDAATTATGFGTGNVSGNSLWNNKKDNHTDANNDITVVVAGAEVLAPVTFVAQVGDNKYPTLQAAIDAAKNGDNTIVLLANNSENVTIKQVEGVNITIDGNGKEFSGAFTIHGNARYNGAETLTFKNINFVTDKAGHYFIDSNSTASAERYAHNVTVKNCTFTATGAAIDTAAAMRIRQGFNISIENVTSTGMHSVLQAYGNKGITVDNLTIVSGKNGVSAGTSTDVVVKNSNINVSGYGVRADGEVVATLTVQNSTITADLPIVVRKTTAKYEVKVEDGALNGTTYGIIFTAGDDGTFVDPAFNPEYTMTGTTAKVYPTSDYVVDLNGKGYFTLADALAAVTAGDNTITLLANNSENVTIKQVEGVNITIDGDGKEFSGTFTIHGNARYDGAETLTFKNIDFVTRENGHYFIDSNSTASAERYAHNVTVENCTFTAIGAAVDTAAAIRIRQGFDITIKDVTAARMHSLAQFYGTSGVVISNAEITGGKNGISVGTSTDVVITNAKINVTGYGIRADGTGAYNMTVENSNITANQPIVVRKATGGYNLTVNGGTLVAPENGYVVTFTKGEDGEALVEPTGDFKATITNVEGKVYPASNYVAELNGKLYFTLADALEAVVAGDNVITLLKNNSENVIIKQVEGVNITIDGNGKEFYGTFTIHGNARYNGEETLTFQNINFVTDKASHYFIDSNSTAAAERYAHNVTVVGCTFTATGAAIDTAAAMRIRQGFDITIKDVTSTGMHSVLQAYGTAGITVDKLTIVNGKNGISAGTSTDVVVKNSNINVTGYGVRADGTVAATLTVVDSTITADLPIVVRKTSAAYVVDVTGGALNGSEYGIIFTAGDDGTFVEPTGGFSYTVTDTTAKVYPVSSYVAKIGDKLYLTLADAIAAVKNGETIVFLKNINEDVTIKQVKNVAFTIDGADYEYYGTMTINGTGYAGAQGQALTIKNIHFKVDGYGISANEKSNFARNITVDGCTFTGTNGTNYDYGMILHSVYNVVVKNTTGTNLYDLVYGRGSVDGFTAENVQVTNSKNGIWLMYPTGKITLTNVTTTGISEAGVGFMNQGTNGVVTFNNCNIDTIVYSEKGTKALKMIFNDTENNLETSGHKYLSIVLNNVDTTVKAIEGLNASTTVSGYKVVYEGGVYKLAKIDYVAQIGGNKYESIQAAVDAAQDGDTIVILASHAVTSDATALILVSGKNITIDLNGYTLNADIVDNGEDSIRYVFRTENGASLTVKNGTVVANGEGVLHYMFSNYDTSSFVIESGNYTLSAVNGGAMFYSANSNMTVKGGNFTQVTSGWMFNTVGNGVGNVITVYGGTFNRYFIGGAEYGENPYGEVKLADGLDLCDNGNGTWSVDEHVHVGGEVVVENKTEPTLGAVGGYDNVVYCQHCGAEMSREHVEVPQLIAVAKIGDTLYVTLQEAIDAVKNGETIVFLKDINENVTIKQVKNVAFTIDGADYKYSGTMTINGTGYAGAQGQALTIKNIHFFVDGYGISANEKSNYARNITVDGCTFTGTNGGATYDYGMILHSVYNIVVKNTIGTNLYDFVYGRGSVDGFTAENVQVTNSANGIWLTYPAGTITFTNVTTATNGGTGVGFKNYGYNGVVTFNNCNIDRIEYSEEGKQALKMIFNDKFNNLYVNEAFGHKYLSIVLNNVDTTVTAIEGLNASTTVSGYKVVYEGGVYKLAKIDYVAQIGDTKYTSIKDAIAAANPGDIIKLIADFAFDAANATTIPDKTTKAFIYIDKNVTIDLNGHNLTAEVPTPVMFVFYVAEGANAVITDSVGNGSVDATGNGLYYMFNNAGTMTVAGGNYIFNGTNGGAMFFSENSNMTVTGGNFVQNNNGWMFNTRGDAAGVVITVSGGTFNRYFIGGTAFGENEDGEVKLAEGLELCKIGENLWTVEVHTHKYSTVVTPPTCTEMGYTTYTCACGDTYVSDYVNATGHNFVATDVKAPTCTEIGYTTYTCACGDTYVSDYVSATGHNFVVVPAVDPTCTETGLTAGVKCSVCGEVLVAQTVVPATGHKFELVDAKAPTCTETGLTAGVQCSVCGEYLVTPTEIPATGHSYTTSIVTPPTYEEPGMKTHTCDECGYSYSEEIPALKAEAKIGTTYYATLAEALAAAKAGETVIVLTDVSISILSVPAEVTLDLNGQMVTVDVAALAYGSIIDTSTAITTKFGGLKIASDKIVHLQPENAGYMPIYDTVNGCYRFFEYVLETPSKYVTETSMAYGIRVLFVNREAYRILAQGDTNVKLTLSVTWEGKKGEPIKHTISENSLISYGKKAYTQAANGNVTTAISITLKGLDSIVGKKLYVTANIASTTAVSGTEDYAVYTVPGAVTTPEEN